MVVFNNSQRLISGQPVKPVDTTGAGDAFVGGLLAQLSQSDDWKNDATIELAVQWANGCGALATTQKGAMTALPTQAELNAYI